MQKTLSESTIKSSVASADYVEPEPAKHEPQNKPEPQLTLAGLNGERESSQDKTQPDPECVRQCPRCGKDIVHRNKYLRNAARKIGRTCRSCSKTFDRATRFWAFVDKKGPDDCWEWTGERAPNGYGRFSPEKGAGHAHQTGNRVAWELTHGPIPKKHVVTITCKNNSCCNPGHLKLETYQELMSRVHGKPVDNSPVFRTCPKCGKQIQCADKNVKRKAERGGWLCGHCAKYEPLDVKFWRYVKKGEPDECWLWQGAVDKQTGYGGISNGFNQHGGRVRTGSHRVSWMIHFGPIPEGMEVCHRCDVRRCNNPAHLFLGTHADNMRDMSVKGRATKIKGEASVCSVLTDEDVRFIRASSMTHTDLAILMGVSDTTIQSVRGRKTWKHVA